VARLEMSSACDLKQAAGKSHSLCCFLLLLVLYIMTKGQKVSEDLAWAIVRMAPILESSDIAAFTSVSERQQRRILSLWRNTGEVVRRRDRRVKGRPRHLTPDDVAVCLWSLILYL
jgi:hypothetical protein